MYIRLQNRFVFAFTTSTRLQWILVDCTPVMRFVKHILQSIVEQITNNENCKHNEKWEKFRDQGSKINALTCSQSIPGVFIAIACQNLPGIPTFEWMRIPNDNPYSGKHLSSPLTILYISLFCLSLVSGAPLLLIYFSFPFFPFPIREIKSISPIVDQKRVNQTVFLCTAFPISKMADQFSFSF